MSNGFDGTFPDFFTAFKFKARFSRIVEDYIIASSSTFNVHYMTNPDATAEQIDLTWQKIEAWIGHLDQSIMCSIDNQRMLCFLGQGEMHFSNNVVMLPNEATEEVMGYVIQAKLNSISRNVLQFGMVSMETKESRGVSVTITGEANDYLPSMEEWLGDQNWFSKPWWYRDDCSTFDVIPEETDDMTVVPEWSLQWTDILGVAVEGDSEKSNNKSPTGAVIPARFKPKLVSDNNEETDD